MFLRNRAVLRALPPTIRGFLSVSFLRHRSLDTGTFAWTAGEVAGGGEDNLVISSLR